MSRCCMRCRALPGACGLQRQCSCHPESARDRAEQLARDFEAAALNRHPQVPDHTQRAILAAQIGIDSAFEVARAHQVPVGAVRDIWKGD